MSDMTLEEISGLMPHALHPSSTTLTEKLAHWAHTRDHKINTWRVDDSEETRRLTALKVSGIITNKSDLLLETRNAFGGVP